MTEIHITADSRFWTGASTLAVHAAKRCSCDAVIITAGNDDMIRRIEAAGVKALKCPMGRFFGALNLSRVLRSVSGDSFRVYVYSPEADRLVENAIKLLGRKEPVELCQPDLSVEFPPVEVQSASTDSVTVYMWLGNITEKCGLRNVIEHLAALPRSDWRLRVVGHGKARNVTPLLRRAEALGVDKRIEWIGYTDNPYKHMAGIAAGIVTAPAGRESVVAREFAAASVPVITNLSEIS